MKDLHKTLSKYHICILPEASQKFEDGMPMFQIFTGDFKKEKQKNNKLKKTKKSKNKEDLDFLTQSKAKDKSWRSS